ncbi:HNH endonuclease [Tsukamurella paurometabola]|uniref:HNH endonuclease n=1 Tax=Tsukamurella paurometabola TaxID=2061 RepID=A0ABS5NDT6_TSUPA|nr:HNH endonuclease [Tsukamurella paurometabola]
MNEKECRRIVIERSEGYCERCGNGSMAVTMDHRKPRSQLGKWEPANISALCGHGTIGCHSWKEHNPRDAAELGFRVWSYQDPREVPVFRRGVWVVLDNEGGFTLA